MFITDIAIQSANEAIQMTKRELKDVRHSILGLDTFEHNVCEFVVTWLEGEDHQSKQAKINVVMGTFELLTKYHQSGG
tara:strand:- start:95 stop:328 length:234 start_codon:yes stop_codon:yes gene_type:complete